MKKTRVSLEFGMNDKEQRLLKHLDAASDKMDKSSYLKFLLEQDMEKKELKERLKLRNVEER